MLVGKLPLTITYGHTAIQKAKGHSMYTGFPDVQPHRSQLYKNGTGLWQGLSNRPAYSQSRSSIELQINSTVDFLDSHSNASWISRSFRMVYARRHKVRQSQLDKVFRSLSM